jgi:hypothetical protein
MSFERKEKKILTVGIANYVSQNDLKCKSFKLFTREGS